MYVTNSFIHMIERDMAGDYDLTACPKEELEAVRCKGREKLAAVLGLPALRNYLVPLAYRKETEYPADFADERIGGSFVPVKYTVEGIKNLAFPVYVLYPERESLGTVLYLHGHDDLGVLGALINREDKVRYHKLLPRLLAEAGYTVAAPELAGFGEAFYEMEDGSREHCFMNAVRLTLCGIPLIGVRTLQAQTALDFLEQAGIGTHISLIGVSGGGLTASMLYALGERMERTGILAFANSYEGSILKKEHCIENYIPGIRNAGDSFQILALGAPKPLLAANGTADRAFTIEGSREAFAYLKRVYERYSAEQEFQGVLFEGKHEIDVETVFKWLSAGDCGMAKAERRIDRWV